MDNPLLKFPPNLRCFCGAEPEKPAKRCCLPKMSLKVPDTDAQLGRDFMSWVLKRLGMGDDPVPENYRQ